MDTAAMKLTDLPTPCLVLDRTILMRNIQDMAAALTRLNVPLRPHMKTAKCIEVARLATAGQPGGITVSTLAEADYFLSHGITDILYAVGITPQKLEQVARMNAQGAHIIVITDDLAVADMIGGMEAPPRTLIEIDSGEERGGVHPDSETLLALGERLGRCLTGVMTHAGHSYAGRSVQAMGQVAEAERAAVARAAQRLRDTGHAIEIVSAGSSPTARHAETMAGVTEIRAGVYMFGDLFQAEIETHPADAIAVTVLTSVIGRRAGRVLVDAGGLALSKDRSTEATAVDYGYGLALDIDGQRSLGHAVVRKAYQEHGVIDLDPSFPRDLPVGTKLRIAPNHTCMTAAAHGRYHVVDGGQEVAAIWDRVNGW
jgi:D-serine deaminase-like pyridoxal phosphate-dependent protein